MRAAVLAEYWSWSGSTARDWRLNKANTTGQLKVCADITRVTTVQQALKHW